MALVALLIPVIVLAVAWAVSGIRVVRPNERAVIERFGRYRKTVGPGTRFTFRFIDTVRRVDVREQVEDIGVEAVSRDKLVLHLDVAMFYRCVDPRTFLYDVADARLAIARLTETEVRGLIGRLSLDQLLGADDVLSAELHETMSGAVASWGVLLTHVELARLEPPEDLMEALIGAATAEKELRATAVANERKLQATMGKTEAAERRRSVQSEAKQRRRLSAAETEKKITILQAEGEAAATRLRADAERYRQQALAHAQADTVRIVSAAIQAGSGGADVMAIKYLEVLGAVSPRSVFTGTATTATESAVAGALTTETTANPPSGNPATNGSASS